MAVLRNDKGGNVGAFGFNIGGNKAQDAAVCSKHSMTYTDKCPECALERDQEKQMLGDQEKEVPAGTHHWQELLKSEILEEDGEMGELMQVLEEKRRDMEARDHDDRSQMLFARQMNSCIKAGEYLRTTPSSPSSSPPQPPSLVPSLPCHPLQWRIPLTSSTNMKSASRPRPWTRKNGGCRNLSTLLSTGFAELGSLL